MIEIVLVGIILLFLFNYLGTIKFDGFVDDNKTLFVKLKESDYDFYLVSKYGDKVDLNLKFQKRCRDAIIVFIVGLIAIMSDFNMILFVGVLVITYLVFKSDYNNVKKYYKKHLHDIDLKLPYYLKSLEILVQHYTVPVAITKSLDTAPDMFKPGLRKLIASIDSGDSSIEPYMEFARTYPVRDAMRMMRLLYRLGLGSQDRKQEQLITFSKTISNLQNKSREQKYKDRLDKMEKKTMTMMTSMGIGVMAILFLSILQTFTSM